MAGSISRRGKHSWRLKFDISRDPATGRRDIRYATVRGSKKDAEAELTRLLAARDTGTLVSVNKLTVAVWLGWWIGNAEDRADISPKTTERYRGLINHQILPQLGALRVQHLRPSQIEAWQTTLLQSGSAEFGPLSARTVTHAHRLLSKALSDAVRQEILARNPALAVPAPTVPGREMEILTAEQVGHVLSAIAGSVIYPHVVLLIATGMRRAELMGLMWADIDLDAGKMKIARSIERTTAKGLRVKQPKTENGKRLITLPATAVAVLRAHRAEQIAIRLALGAGKLPDGGFVFGTLDGKPRDPGYLTQAWRRLVVSRKLPKTTLHALRHSHASALIARGTDPVTVSRRLGHSSPTTTLSTYAHLFDKSDGVAALIIDELLETGKK